MTSRVANHATVRMRRASLRDLPVDTLGDGVVVRPLDHSEEPLLAELLDQAYDDEPWNVDRVRAELIDDPSVATVFLVAGPAGLVATASVQFKPAFSDSGWVHWVATDPAHRRRGFGKVVVLRVLQEIARAGRRDALLDTQEHRLSAIRLYMRLGFEPLIVRREDHEVWVRIGRALASLGQCAYALGHQGDARRCEATPEGWLTRRSSGRASPAAERQRR